MKARPYQMTDSPIIMFRSVVMTAALVLCWGMITLAGPLSHAKETPEGSEKFHRDRQAILAMAGNYHVRFSFEETASFVEGYQLKDPYVTEGNEIVRVIQDEGDFISLQHMLVVEGIWGEDVPIKHWRQDWLYEPDHVFEYVGHNVWRTRHVSEVERRGKWAQLVYQVDDSPRYAAVAEWRHEQGVSSWTSPPTWRPLPRREATKRDDYDVLVSVNRQALTPTGWVHEQESSKLILGDDPHILVHEIGVNTYTSSNEFQIQIAEDYWKDTKPFWSEVRAEWKQVEDEFNAFRVKTRGQSGKLYNRILALADHARSGELDMGVAAARARKIIRASTTTDVAHVDSGEGVLNRKTGS